MGRYPRLNFITFAFLSQYLFWPVSPKGNIKVYNTANSKRALQLCSALLTDVLYPEILVEKGKGGVKTIAMPGSLPNDSVAVFVDVLHSVYKAVNVFGERQIAHKINAPAVNAHTVHLDILLAGENLPMDRISEPP